MQQLAVILQALLGKTRRRKVTSQHSSHTPQHHQERSLQSLIKHQEVVTFVLFVMLLLQTNCASPATKKSTRRTNTKYKMWQGFLCKEPHERTCPGQPHWGHVSLLWMWKDFKNKQGLARHTKMHTGNYKFKCQLCPTEFTYSADFNNHMNKHMNLKPHVCAICGREFGSRRDYIFHTRICDMCINKFWMLSMSSVYFIIITCWTSDFFLGHVKKLIKIQWFWNKFSCLLILRVSQ